MLLLCYEYAMGFSFWGECIDCREGYRQIQVAERHEG